MQRSGSGPGSPGFSEIISIASASSKTGGAADTYALGSASGAEYEYGAEAYALGAGSGMEYEYGADIYALGAAAGAEYEYDSGQLVGAAAERG